MFDNIVFLGFTVFLFLEERSNELIICITCKKRSEILKAFNLSQGFAISACSLSTKSYFWLIDSFLRETC